MPANSHHVALCTDDPAAVHRFLTEVVGLQVYLEFFVPGENLTKTAGWPENDGAAVVMYGESPGGLVEVIAIPDELRGVVEPRIWLVSFAVGDLEQRLDAARRLGVDAPDPMDTTGQQVELRASMMDVGGVTWELVRFLA